MEEVHNAGLAKAIGVSNFRCVDECTPIVRAYDPVCPCRSMVVYALIPCSMVEWLMMQAVRRASHTRDQ